MVRRNRSMLARQRSLLTFIQIRTSPPHEPAPSHYNSHTTTQKMESLLSLSFDYLSSSDGIKIKKGLRQLEGLLAQICLSRTTTTTNNPSDRRNSAAIPPSSPSKKQITKELSSLKDDPAFREFFKLQEGFEWNGNCLSFLIMRVDDGAEK